MIIRTASFFKSAVSPAQYPSADRPEVAFVGRSNVGKSTLINSLLGRRSLVRSSRMPGRTQMLNFFLINDAFFLVDLPGYGFAQAPREVRLKWLPMIRNYLCERKNLRAVVLLLDIRRIPSEEDLNMLDLLEDFSIPAIPVITKVDKVKRSERIAQQKQIARTTGLEEDNFSCFSSVTREGDEDIWGRIETALAGTDVSDRGGRDTRLF